MYRGQHGRKAFGAQKPVSQRTLARYIAESIRQHRAAGRDRTAAQYTSNPETQRLVRQLLEDHV